jgi:hypothetical protein
VWHRASAELAMSRLKARAKTIEHVAGFPETPELMISFWLIVPDNMVFNLNKLFALFPFLAPLYVTWIV